MVERQTLKQAFRVNQVLVDPKNYQIEKAGKKEEITTRALDLLLFLIHKDGEVVTREEIEQEVWKGPINENSLYQQITSLRKFLGDNPNKPVFIKTVPKRGYQFVGELDLTTPKPTLSYNKKNIGIWLLLAIISLGTTSTFYAYWKDSKANEINSIASTLLHYPRQTVALELPEENASPSYKGLIRALYLILEYQLDQAPEQHIAYTPNGLSWEKLASTFSKNAKLSHIIRFRHQQQDNKLLITVNIFAGKQTEPTQSISLQVLNNNQASALPAFETKLIQTLKTASLIPVNNKPVLDDHLESNQQLIAAASSVSKPVQNTAQLEKALPKTYEIIKKNPDNLVAHNLIWEQIYHLIQLNSQFYVDKSMGFLAETIQQAIAINPNYYKTHYMQGEYFYWVRDALEKSESSRSGSIAAFKRAAELKPYNHKLLSALSWHSFYFSESYIPEIDKINYELNPYQQNVVNHYRNSLLAKRKFKDAVNVMLLNSQHPGQNTNWYVQAQTKTTIEKLQRFANRYQDWSKGTQTPVAMRKKLIYADQLPTKYIGYMLLDSGNPELAAYWVKNGLEKAPYFDFKAIDLRADLWKGSWRPEKWHAIHATISNSPWPKNQLDKLSVLYFHYLSDLFKRCEETITSIFPEFMSDDISINENNFRYAVYYSELTKRLNKYKQSIKINKAIKSFLISNEITDRNLHFGIADAEFYALNGDKEKAIKILEQAIYKKDWLPNSFWLWPPIEHNPFLQNIERDIRFLKMVEHIQNKTNSICLKSPCKKTTSPHKQHLPKTSAEHKIRSTAST